MRPISDFLMRWPARLFLAHALGYSGTVSPVPPSSRGKSFSLVSVSHRGSAGRPGRPAARVVACVRRAAEFVEAPSLGPCSPLYRRSFSMRMIRHPLHELMFVMLVASVFREWNCLPGRRHAIRRARFDGQRLRLRDRRRRRREGAPGKALRSLEGGQRSKEHHDRVVRRAPRELPAPGQGSPVRRPPRHAQGIDRRSSPRGPTR